MAKKWNELDPTVRNAIDKHIFKTKIYCIECGDDITESKYLTVCENCRIQTQLLKQ